MYMYVFTGITTNFYGAGQGPILLDNVECLGVESTILECPYDTHTSDCSHNQDTGVVCLLCELNTCTHYMHAARSEG